MTTTKIVCSVFCMFLCSFMAHGAESILKDSTFSEENGWKKYIHKSEKDAGSSIEFKDGKAIIAVKKTETLKWWHIYISNSVNLEANTKYKLTLLVKSDKAGRITTSYSLPQRIFSNAAISIEAGEKKYECIFTVKPDKEGKFDPGTLRLVFGLMSDTILEVSDIHLEKAE